MATVTTAAAVSVGSSNKRDGQFKQKTQDDPLAALAPRKKKAPKQGDVALATAPIVKATPNWPVSKASVPIPESKKLPKLEVDRIVNSEVRNPLCLLCLPDPKGAHDRMPPRSSKVTRRISIITTTARRSRRMRSSPTATSSRSKSRPHWRSSSPSFPRSRTVSSCSSSRTASATSSAQPTNWRSWQ